MIMLWVFHYQITLQLQDNDVSAVSLPGTAALSECFAWFQVGILIVF